MTRTLLVLALVALVVLAVWGMRRGWVHRGDRQAGLLTRFPEPPAAVGPATLGPFPGLYVGAVVAGDWQDRVAVERLGLRGAGRLAVHADGVLVERTGERDVWLPRGELAGVRTDRALAGKAMTTRGLLVLTWAQRPGGPGADPDPDHPDIELGFRADDPAPYPAVLAALGAPEEDA
ncbi:transporter [Rhodococcus aerolatus]